MSDVEQHNRAPQDDGSTAGNFVNALEFVDAEIERASRVSDLSVEGLVTLAILRIVRSPDVVRVNITRAQRMVILEYDVRMEDIGQVIGKGGHTIDAIRSLSKSATGSADIEYVIYLMEDGKPALGYGTARGPKRRGGYPRGDRRRR